MSENVVGLNCRRCGAIMAEMEEGELDDLLYFGSLGDSLCFDCDPESADRIPDFFVDWWTPGVIQIADVSFETIVDGEGCHKLVQSRARAHTRVHARARGLSSSTYLNKTLHNVVNGMVEETTGECPFCRAGVWMPTEEERGVCPVCGEEFVSPGWVLVPSWLLEGGVK